MAEKLCELMVWRVAAFGHARLPANASLSQDGIWVILSEAFRSVDSTVCRGRG